MALVGKRKLVWPRVERRELVHAVRTTIVAVGSLLIARLCRLPEAYWAAITAMIVMQSTLGAALAISKQRLIGTALGSLMGGAARDLYGAQRGRIRGRHPAVRNHLRRAPHGTKRLPLCGDHSDHYHAGDTQRTGVGYRHSSLHRNLAGHRRSTDSHRRMA